MLDYTELFDYFKTERSALLSAFEKMPFEELSKNRELSFYSMKGTFVHTIDVEDNLLHFVYPKIPHERADAASFADLEAIKKFIHEVDGKTNSLFAKLSPSNLADPVTRKYPDGREATYTLDQVLYQIPIEVIHHYGEIFAEFWKMNMEAPYISYLRYSSSKGSNRP